MSTPREQWGSRYGFVLATIGGAVGIGNIWRFSYVAGENGGAVFLFIYLAFVFLIGVPLMIAELAIGRHAHRLRLPRWRATAGMGACVFLLGLPSALSYGLLSHIRIGSHGILEVIDYGVSNFLLPTTGILTALYVGWRLERAFVLNEADFGESRVGTVWLWLVRILVPVTILGILLQSAESL